MRSEGTHTYDCLCYCRQSQALICVCSVSYDRHYCQHVPLVALRPTSFVAATFDADRDDDDYLFYADVSDRQEVKAGVRIRVAVCRGVTRTRGVVFRGESKGALDCLLPKLRARGVAEQRSRELVKRVSHFGCVRAGDCEVRNSRHFSVAGRLEITAALKSEGHFVHKNSTLSAHQMAPPS